MTPTTFSSQDVNNPSIFPQNYELDASHQPYTSGIYAENSGFEAPCSPDALWPGLGSSSTYYGLSVSGDLISEVPRGGGTMIRNSATAEERIPRRNNTGGSSGELALIHVPDSQKRNAPVHLRPKISLTRRVKPPKSVRPPKNTSTGPSISGDNGSPSCEVDPVNRANHNLIERKYRNRLNEQFDTLLAVLPASTVDGQSLDESSQPKRISKAEVLILAKQRIETLEKERGQLGCEKCKHRESLDLIRLQYGPAVICPT